MPSSIASFVACEAARALLDSAAVLVHSFSRMAQDKAKGFVVWALDARRYALPVAHVERVLAAVAISPLAGAPAPICGSLNLRGEPISMLDLRQHLGLPPKELRLDDHLVLARTARRQVGFFVDAVEAVVDRLDDAVLLAGELERVLGPLEEAQLERALAQARAA
jgi:purine-binding chemotaxis protein CheW